MGEAEEVMILRVVDANTLYRHPEPTEEAPYQGVPRFSSLPHALRWLAREGAATFGGHHVLVVRVLRQLRLEVVRTDRVSIVERPRAPRQRATRISQDLAREGSGTTPDPSGSILEPPGALPEDDGGVT